MKKLILILTVLALSIGLFARNYKPIGKKMHNAKRNNSMVMKLNELNLTEKQEDKVAKLRTAHQKQMVDLHATEKKAKIDKRDALYNQNFSKAKMYVKKMYEAKEKIALQKLELHENIYKILTAEQKVKLKTLKPKNNMMMKNCGQKSRGNNGKMMRKRDCSGDNCK